MPPPDAQPPRRYRLARGMRIVQRRDFDVVYQTGAKTSVGPLLVWVAPNTAGHWRLGLAMARRVGSAPVRNRLRRRIRESFRLLQHDLPGGSVGYDVVVAAQAHEPLTLERYQGMLLDALRRLERRWSNRKDSASA